MRTRHLFLPCIDIKQLKNVGEMAFFDTQVALFSLLCETLSVSKCSPWDAQLFFHTCERISASSRKKQFALFEFVNVYIVCGFARQTDKK